MRTLQIYYSQYQIAVQELEYKPPKVKLKVSVCLQFTHIHSGHFLKKKDAASPDGGAIAGAVIGVVIFIAVVAVVVVLVLLIVTRQLNRKKQFDRIQMDIFAM